MKKQKVSPLLIFGLLGILAILSLIITSVSGKGVKSPRSRHLFDRSETGYYGFRSILKKLDFKVKREFTSYTRKKKANVVFYIDSSKEDEFLTSLAINWISEGNHLLAYSSTSGYIFNDYSDGIANDELVKFKHKDLSDIETIKSQYFIDSTLYQHFDSYEVLAYSKNGDFIVKGHIGDGSITLIADPNLFNNEMFYNNKKEIVYILEYLLRPFKGKKILIRERVAEYTEKPSFVKDFFTGKFSFLTLQIVVMFILFVMYVSKRFIKPSNLMSKEKRKITEHINAVGYLYKRAKAEELVTDIDIEFFKLIVCKNRKPFNISSTDYDRAISTTNFKDGFTFREKLSKKIKLRSSND